MIKWGGHRSDRGDWDRQKEEVMGDRDQGGGQKEEVRRGRGEREQIAGDGGQGGGVQRKWWSKEEVGGRKWRKNTQHWEPLLSKWVFPGRGLQAGEEAPGSQLVWGEYREGDSLAPGLRPGSLDSSQK